MKYFLLVLCLAGCGGGDAGASDCGGSLETSCDVPSDNGAHTCYDVVAVDDAGLARAKTTCAGSATSGSVLGGCCGHDAAVARCVFLPTEGGTSTEWFLSGSVAGAQSACASKGGTFTMF